MRPDIGWTSIQRRFQGEIASFYTTGEMCLLGEPLWHANKFYSNVFAFERARVEVLRADQRTAETLMSIYFRHGPLTIIDGPALVPTGQLKQPLEVITCDLTRFAT